MNIPFLLASLSALYDVRRAPRAYSGIIIALPIPANVAQAAAVPGGLPADEMHVTLAYLGNIEEQQDATPFLHLAELLHELAQGTPAMVARFGGPGVFTQADGPKAAAYLSVDAPALPAFRQACVDAARTAGVYPDMTHGFTPHMTLAYQDPAAPHPLPQPDTGPFLVPHVGLWLAGHHVSFPFTGTLSKAAGAMPPNADPRVEARTLLAQLSGDLARLDAEDAAICARADQVATHHDQMVRGLTSAIPAVRGSLVEAAALHHAGEAQDARRAAAHA